MSIVLTILLAIFILGVIVCVKIGEGILDVMDYLFDKFVNWIKKLIRKEEP